MQTPLKLLLLSVLIMLFSCETNDFNDEEESYLDNLQGRAIIAIHIQDDTKYIFTSKFCDTCYVAPHMSHIPTINECTVIKNSIFETFSIPQSFGLPASDSEGNLYIANSSNIFKLNDSGEYEQME
jgi:hypothetical protein